MVLTGSKAIHIRSRDADDYFNGTSGFTIKLREPIICPRGYFMQISVHNAQIPYTFYNINTTNNTLVYQETIGGVVYQRQITITPGNYNVTQLKGYLTQQMIALNSNTMKYTFLYNAIKNMMVIQTDTSGCSCVISKNSTCLQFLGFDGSRNVSFSYGIQASSDVPIVMFSVNAIYVLSNIVFGSSSFSSRTKASSPILCKVPIDVPPNSLISYFPQRVTKTSIDTRMVSEISLLLTDEDGTTIDLNGCHWELTIEVEFNPIPDYVEAPFDRAMEDDLYGIEDQVQS